MQVTVHANKVPISPRKLRFAIHTLRGLTVEQAIAIMSVSPRQTVRPVVKLLQASISAARDRSPAVTGPDLRVVTLFVNEGARLYRGRRRSKGRVSRMAKGSSHLTLSVQFSDASSQTPDKHPKSAIRYPTSARKVARTTSPVAMKQSSETSK